jgi:ClpP class serine protease
MITPGGYASIRNLLAAKMTGDDIDPSMFVNPRREMAIDENGIAHIHVLGVLAGGISQIEKACGATDYNDLADELAEASDCRGVWLEIDSPGGAVAGNDELVQQIRAMSRRVPTMAWTEADACSAAYNIGVSCRRFHASQSATVGSIGVIIPWCDSAEAWRMQGLSWEPITNKEGDLKGSGAGPSLTQAQRDSLQEYAQDAFALFRGNVLANRRVSDDMMRGQAFLAPRAAAGNLIDKVATKTLAYADLMSML